MWRNRMQDFSRAVGKPHSPLFAPLLFHAAAQVEAIDPDAMARDATRIRKNVGEFRRMLKLDAVFCCAPSMAELNAIGRPDHESDLEKIAGEERVAASLGACRQWHADKDAPVIVVALTGPMSLCAALTGAGQGYDEEVAFEHVGRGLAALVRLFAEAGAHVVQFHETATPNEDQRDYWKSALGTAGNVARFHRVAPLLIIDAPSLDAWPPQMIACPSAAQQTRPMTQVRGAAWNKDPASWAKLSAEPSNVRFITISSEVAADTDIRALLDCVEKVRSD